MATKDSLMAHAEPASLSEIARNFFILGTTAFGGPPVHFGMFQERFVQKQQWLTSERYMELIAMANCLPGPSSTQVAFAIGISQQGIMGGLAAGFMFLIPGAILMTCLGFVSASLREEMEEPRSIPNAVAISCSAVGVALVFIAVSGLVKKIATGPLVSTICFASAATCMLLSPQPAWLNPTLIFAGGLITCYFPVSNTDAAKNLTAAGKVGLNTSGGLFIFGLYVVMAVFTMYKAATDRGPFISFLTAGMFVWGGGPVVLPMLMTVLAPHFISQTIFLTGIALAEMMPGPVFNMSCFLGVQLALSSGMSWQLGTFMAWAGLVGPGVVLIFGAMPLWDKLRSFE
ncbi:unnamed protein product, partial [Polarella glacialis]